MSDFSGFINDFKNWFTHACNIEKETNGQDATTGEILENVWTTVQSSVSFAIDTSNSVETNINDKFINQKILTAYFDPNDLTESFTIKNRILFNSDYYYVEGDDDIHFLDEVLILTLRKEYEA